VERALRTFYEELANFARLILLDERDTGLSDRPRDLGTLETRVDDIRSVLDAAGSETATLFGSGEGRPDLRVLRRAVSGAHAGTGPDLA
jgi:pimeloyl-ACP methyl ester carboxylesterase